MLKELIKKKYLDLFSKKDDSKEFFPLKLRGELEIKGISKNKIIHYDKQDNTITIWGKHAVMHLLTGDVFSSAGRTRLTGTSDHVGDSINNDGTLLSGKQYFDASNFPGTYGWWSQSNPNLLSQLFPYFPVKMLFGTGFEFSSWNNIASTIGDNTYTDQYTSQGFNSTNFNANISSSANYYSNIYESGNITQTKTMNDIYAQELTTPIITENNFGVSGAIKDGLYNNRGGDSAKLETSDGNLFSRKNYQGIGRPSFIYGKRESRFFQSGADISLEYDNNFENKISFVTVMPEQSGVYSGDFYPYNGFTLKVAGLFCDSRFMLENDVPTNKNSSDDAGLTEYDNYRKMPGGIMWAGRALSPITKRHDVNIIATWSIYL